MATTIILAALVSTLSTLAAPPTEPSWSETDSRTIEDVRAGRPLVTYVVVPLCSNTQINCGSAIAGRPGDLAHNIYWGAIFGARRFLDRKASPWSRVDVATANGPMLEQVSFRRSVDGVRWGLPNSTVEQIVVLQAVHGDSINQGVEQFWRVATEGGVVKFQDGGRAREARIHVVGYAGHNRLMDGVRLPPAPDPARRAPIAAFVLACHSEPYFGRALRAAGVQVLLTTRALMAPEGYLIDAVVRTVGDNRGVRTVRSAAIEASVRWQGIERKDASWIFAPPALDHRSIEAK
jgi:hypothetical protein